jgi:hypothetical protein
MEFPAPKEKGGVYKQTSMADQCEKSGLVKEVEGHGQ